MKSAEFISRIGIIPIFLGDNGTLWNSSAGKELMVKALRAALDACEIERLLVISDNSHVAALANSYGIESYVVDISKDFNRPRLLPRGSYVAMQYSREELRLDFGTVVILGFRNPLVTGRLIDAAIRRFQAHKAPGLMSVRKPTDHPCQLNTYHKIEDVGFIHMFEDGYRAASLLRNLVAHSAITFGRLSGENTLNRELLSQGCLKLTKPFHFNWKDRGIQAGNGRMCYVRSNTRSGTAYVPTKNPYHRDGPIWIHDSENTARILFRLETVTYEHRGDDCPVSRKPISRSAGMSEKCTQTNPNILQINQRAAYAEETGTMADMTEMRLQIVGATLCSQPSKAEAILGRIADNGIVVVFNKDEPLSCPHEITIAPVSDSGSQRGEIFQLEAHHRIEPFALRCNTGNICGVAYCLTRVGVNDSYDLCEQFPHHERLWSGTIHKTNVMTSRRIMGRQDFPDVFEPDGTFFIMNEDVASSFEKATLNEAVIGYPLEESESMPIDSELDILRYLAITGT